MSRLDSFIRRLEAQRRMLDWAAALVAGTEGPVLELGLGNGRTYDHLRENLPGRAIYVFEKNPSPNPRSMPPADRLIVGDMAQTLPAFARTHPRGAALVHADVTTGVPERDTIAFAWLPARILELTRRNALVISGWPLDHAGLSGIALPDGVPEGRYFAYRARPSD